MHPLFAIALGLIFLVFTPATAKHAQCYWHGPGQGSPKDQGFSEFCTAKQRQVVRPNLPPVIEYYCEAYGRTFVVADYNKLRLNVLEMATPCGGNGYAGVCHREVWGFTLNDFVDPQTGEKNPFRAMYYRDDCEWIGDLKPESVPATITIFNK